MSVIGQVEEKQSALTTPNRDKTKEKNNTATKSVLYFILFAQINIREKKKQLSDRTQ